MKILVTGANGYLGNGIVTQLINSGHTVIGASRSIDNIDLRAERYKCDIFNIDDPYVYFGKPDILLHLAWKDGFKHFSESHLNDLPKHYAFLSKMANSNISQIAVMGTMHEIGFFEGSINENTPCNPVTPYGISKNALRQLTCILGNSTNTTVKWLRAFYIVGNTNQGESIFSKISKSAAKGLKKFPFNTGRNQYDFIDYSLFCEQVVCALEQTKINGVINICSGFPEKLADRVIEFINENKLDISLSFGAFPDRSYDAKAIWGSNKKISEIMSKREH